MNICQKNQVTTEDQKEAGLYQAEKAQYHGHYQQFRVVLVGEASVVVDCHVREQKHATADRPKERTKALKYFEFVRSRSSFQPVSNGVQADEQIVISLDERDHLLL